MVHDNSNISTGFSGNTLNDILNSYYYYLMQLLHIQVLSTLFLYQILYINAYLFHGSEREREREMYSKLNCAQGAAACHHHQPHTLPYQRL